MSLTSKEKGGSFTPAPAGTHRARCCHVIDIGTQNGSWQGKPIQREEVIIRWELCDEPVETDEGVRPMIISQRYTNSLNPKANLRHVLESWRGKPFNADELKGFDLRKILGTACLLNVVHKPSKDGTKTYANVSAVTPLPKGMEKPPAMVNKPVCYDCSEGVTEVYNALPPFYQKLIALSVEWNGGKPAEPVNEDSEPDTQEPDDLPDF